MAKHNNGHAVVSTPLSKIPVFLRGGSIVPKRERVRRSSELMKKDPFTLWVALDKQQQASGSIYVDDGSSFAYEKGEYVYCTFEFKDHVLTATPGEYGSPWVTNGDLETSIERILLIGLKTIPSQIFVGQEPLDFIVNGNAVEIKLPKVVVGQAWSILVK